MTKMEITRIERTILSNQYEILGIIDSENKDHFDMMKKILDSGFEFLYDDALNSTYPDEETLSYDNCLLVIHILDMFRAITDSLSKVTDKTSIDTSNLKFRGFDGNNEPTFLDFAKFFCTEFGGPRFPEIGQGIDNFNSHMPTLDTYGRMLEEWNRLKNRNELSKDELISISKAAIHPLNR
jgi:uncharacterized protein YfbU (UPF0304 family)